MLEAIGRNWWLLVVRGIASILFGLAVILAPGVSLLTLVFVFGWYALADGVISIVLGIRRERSVGWSLVRGVIGILAGVVAFRYPGRTASILYTLIGAWAIGIGIAEIVTAIALRKRARARGVGIGVTTGVLSIAVGVLLLALPQAGIIALLGLVAAYAVVHGVLMIGAGIDVHHIAGERIA